VRPIAQMRRYTQPLNSCFLDEMSERVKAGS
jgi:hypothetical protein